jgi:hypothetical protein
LKKEEFRKEFVEFLTFQITVRAKLPHYVVLFGTEMDMQVKYSKKTLMQILVNKQFNLTLFEVP